jgi:phosphoribosyl 1,2-cyclic phosphate phosphodiesterase
MQLEVLGSGGAVTTPRPHCTCGVCVEARAKGIPYARTGPSVFVHGPDVLIDTPEESKLQLDRSRITRIAAALYSHWHPDHTAGRRVWETRNYDFRPWPREAKRVERTPVYLPERVAADFREWMGLWDHFEFLQERQGTVRVHELRDGDTVELGGTAMTPIRLAEDYVYAFLFEGDGERVLVAMDELNGWTPPDLGPLDLAYLPLGIFEHHPFTGERAIHPEHPLLRLEATYPETLEIVGALDARRVVLSHVEHMDGLSHDDLVRLGDRDGWEPAYDGMLIDQPRDG